MLIFVCVCKTKILVGFAVASPPGGAGGAGPHDAPRPPAPPAPRSRTPPSKHAFQLKRISRSLISTETSTNRGRNQSYKQFLLFRNILITLYNKPGSNSKVAIAIKILLLNGSQLNCTSLHKKKLERPQGSIIDFGRSSEHRQIWSRK